MWRIRSGCVAESSRYWDKVGLAPRRVSPEGDDVFDTRLVQASEYAVDLVLRLAYAGEMGHWQQVGLFLDSGDYLLGEGLGCTARAVGDGDEVRVEDCEPIDGPKDGRLGPAGSWAGRTRRKGSVSSLRFR